MMWLLLDARATALDLFRPLLANRLVGAELGYLLMLLE